MALILSLQRSKHRFNLLQAFST